MKWPSLPQSIRGEFRSFTPSCLTLDPVFSLLHSTLSERNLDTRNSDKGLCQLVPFWEKQNKKWGCGDQRGLNVKNKGSKARKELKWPWEYFRKLSLITQQEVSLAGQTPLKTRFPIFEPNPSWSPLGKDKTLTSNRFQMGVHSTSQSSKRWSVWNRRSQDDDA